MTAQAVPEGADVVPPAGTTTETGSADVVPPLTWPGEAGDWVLVEETVEELAPGVTYAAWRIQDGERAQALYLLRVSLAGGNWEVKSLLASDRVAGLETVLQMAERLQNEGERIVAAVNSDFYMSQPVWGQPLGIHVSGGEVVTSPNGRPAFVAFADGSVWIGYVEMEATLERLNVAHSPLLRIAAINRAAEPNGITLYTPRFGDHVTVSHPDAYALVVQGVTAPLAVGAELDAWVVQHVPSGGSISIPKNGWVLVGRGRAADELARMAPFEALRLRVSLSPSFAEYAEAVAGGHILVERGEAAALNPHDPLVVQRHPRTAIGYGGGWLYLVVADGRQNGYSSGLTLPELSEILVRLGMEAALNLDGGGSSTMVVWSDEEGRLVIVNQPSDGTPRVVANGLAVVDRRETSVAPRRAARRWASGRAA